MNLVVFFRAGLNFRGVARRGGRGESGRFLFACLKCGTSGRLSSEEESAVGGTEGPAAEIWKEAEGSGVGRAAEGWKVEGSGVGRAAGAWKVEVGRVGSGIESICTAGLGKAGEIRSSKREAEAIMAGKEEEVGWEGTSGISCDNRTPSSMTLWIISSQ